MSEKPRDALWFAAGIRFECRRCGKCCRGEPGWVWVSTADIAHMAERLGLSRDEFLRRHVRRDDLRLSLRERPNGDCVLWQDGCTVYDVRPVQCRTFPFWKGAVLSAERFAVTHRDCPGVGQGRLYSCEEILAISQGLKDT